MLRLIALAVLSLALPVLAQTPTPSAKPPKMNVIASWGDITLVYGPGTAAAMDTDAAMEKMFAHWKARGFTGIYLRTDLSTNPPGAILRSPEKTQPNAMLGLSWRLIDQIMEKADPHVAASRAAKKVGFEHWMFHPYIYSEGAPPEIGKDGLGRMVPWSYARKYHVEHPEIISVDRAGNRLWMVPEYAYPGARAEKVAEFVHMAKTYKPTGLIASMRSEVSQLIDPPEHGDQYGFNEPVVEEMKRRYDVDIRTDPRFDYKSPSFDLNDPMLNKWRDLRGEYLTALFRETRAALRKVDPKVKFGVTLSGDHIGPLLGNWRLEWRKWIDEGIVDTIVMPVFFEATLDADADKKSYLTHSRLGKGVTPAAEVKAYVAKSKHPEIEVIHTGAPSYFYPAPPEGTDGWQCDIWYDAYTNAFAERWKQFMADVKEFGHVKFLHQDFDAFPLTSSGKLQLGEGDMRYDPARRSCPGGWSDFGDGSNGKAEVQDKVRRGSSGNALLLKTRGLTGQHFSSPDRGRFTGMLDVAPANGTVRVRAYVRRDDDTSGLRLYVTGNVAHEADVGVRLMADGTLHYAEGAAFKPTAQKLAKGQWHKITVTVDVDGRTYGATVGDDDTPLCKGVAFAPPADRYIEEIGVHVPIKAQAYRVFNTVSLAPDEGPNNRVYVDDVDMTWTPAKSYSPAGKRTLLGETFEKLQVGKLPPRGASGWQAKGDAEVQRTTSYGDGSRSVRANGPLTISADVPAVGSGATVIDLDAFVQSDKNFPYLLPDPTTKSAQGITVGLYSGDTPVAAVRTEAGKWQAWDGKALADTGKPATYDVWGHVQLVVDAKSKRVRLVTQPIGESPTVAAELPLAAVPAGKLTFRLSADAAKPNHPVCFDNLSITAE